MESKRIAKIIGNLNNSILSGSGNRAGILGEIALANFLKVERQDKRGYDLIYKGKKIEVKTKRRTADPKGYYEASVSETSSHQTPDFYAFLSLTFGKKEYNGKEDVYSDLQSIWLCGFIAYEDFIKEAKLIRTGTIDEDNGFATITDMRNIRYEKLEKGLKKKNENNIDNSGEKSRVKRKGSKNPLQTTL